MEEVAVEVLKVSRTESKQRRGKGNSTQFMTVKLVACERVLETILTV